MSRVDKIDAATAVAFNALQAEALKLGLQISPVESLDYLPDMNIFVRFKNTCRAVIQSLESRREMVDEEKAPAGGKA